MNRVQDKPEPLALVYIEEQIGLNGPWVRQRRYGVPLHPVYGAQQVKLLKRIHPSAQYRCVPVPTEVDDANIPF